MPASAADRILTINTGSSSLKVGLYGVVPVGSGPRALARLDVSRIGAAATLSARDAGGTIVSDGKVDAGNHAAALSSALEWLRGRDLLRPDSLLGASHRFVHG